MRVTIYDTNPGKGIGQWGLKFSWWLGCFLQKLFGAVDDYYGASSWDDAMKWLSSRPSPLKSIQYWGHGSPGTVWLASKSVNPDQLIATLKLRVTPDSVLWFRTCSTFQGQSGFNISAKLADGLNCTVAGHTRIVGLLQPGLHTRKPNTPPSWPITEVEFQNAKWPYLQSDNRTIICLRTTIPKGW